jgi:hypothetical protein
MQIDDMFQILETRLATESEFRSALAAAGDAEAALSVIGVRLRDIGIQCSDADARQLLVRLEQRLQTAMTAEDMEGVVGGGGSGLMTGMQSAGTVFKALAAGYNPHRNDGTIENSGGAVRGYKT